MSKNSKLSAVPPVSQSWEPSAHNGGEQPARDPYEMGAPNSHELAAGTNHRLYGDGPFCGPPTEAQHRVNKEIMYPSQDFYGE
jgi:hypothetical protein